MCFSTCEGFGHCIPVRWKFSSQVVHLSANSLPHIPKVHSKFDMVGHHAIRKSRKAKARDTMLLGFDLSVG